MAVSGLEAARIHALRHPRRRLRRIAWRKISETCPRFARRFLRTHRPHSRPFGAWDSSMKSPFADRLAKLTVLPNSGSCLARRSPPQLPVHQVLSPRRPTVLPKSHNGRTVCPMLFRKLRSRQDLLPVRQASKKVWPRTSAPYHAASCCGTRPAQSVVSRSRAQLCRPAMVRSADNACCRRFCFKKYDSRPRVPFSPSDDDMRGHMRILRAHSDPARHAQAPLPSDSPPVK